MDEHRDSHLEWLHGEYLPRLFARQGFAWIAHYQTVPSRTSDDRAHFRECTDERVGRGRQYLLLVGACAPEVFFDQSLPDSWFLSETVKRAVSTQHGVREGIFIEEARVDGPAARMLIEGACPAPVVQFGAFNTETADDAMELGRYYRQNCFPAVAQSHGCVRARKLLATVGWARHGIFYEFTSLDSRRAHFEELIEWGSDPRVAAPDNPFVWPGRFPTEYVVFALGSPRGTRWMGPARPHWAVVVAAIAILFGALTVVSGGTALFGGSAARAAVGNAVPFVLWFNFAAGFAYVLAGVGLFLWRRWAAMLSAAIAFATLTIFVVFGWYATELHRHRAHSDRSHWKPMKAAVTPY